jgi:predicted nucleic acid-binding protein
LIVLDASLIIEWLVGDKQRPDIPHLHELLLDTEIVVPAHWPVEVSNFLRTRLNNKQITIREAHLILERLDMLEIAVDAPIQTDEVVPLAIFSSSHGLTTYDGVYVQLAFHHKAILATVDIAMREAAARLDIALLPA